MNRIAAAQTELEESRYRNSLVNEQTLFLTFYYLFSFFNLSICIENYIFDDKFLYSRNQNCHCIIIRFPVFRRKLNVESIGIFGIEVMAIIEFPGMSGLMASGGDKNRRFHWNGFSMYNCHMIVCSVLVITILSRTEHINRCSVFLEHLNIIANICGNAFRCFTRSNKWERSCNTVITFQTLAPCRFTKKPFKIICIPFKRLKVFKCAFLFTG